MPASDREGGGREPVDALERFRVMKRKQSGAREFAPEGLRAPNEDDDGYDPYSDFMDALARSSYEEPSADPWK